MRESWPTNPYNWFDIDNPVLYPNKNIQMKGNDCVTDVYALLRQEIASVAGALLGLPLNEEHVEIPALGYAARSAMPLRYGANPWEWASMLQENREKFHFLRVPLIKCVEANGGHLLFTLTDDFYTTALGLVLHELPPFLPDPAKIEDESWLSRIRYTQHRMWMLSRRAEGEIFCPAIPAAQRAFLLGLGLSSHGLKKRAVELRLLEAAEALLYLPRCMPPIERPGFHRACAHVGDGTARLLALGLQQV